MAFSYEKTNNDKKIQDSLLVFHALFNVAIKNELSHYRQRQNENNICKNTLLGNPELFKQAYEESSEELKLEKSNFYFKKLSKNIYFREAEKIIEKRHIKRASISELEQPLIELPLLLAGIISNALVDGLGLDPGKSTLTMKKIKSISTRAKQLRRELKKSTPLERLLPKDFMPWLEFLTDQKKLKEWNDPNKSPYMLKKGRKDTGKRELFLRSFCKSFNKYFQYNKQHLPINLLEQIILIVDENTERRAIPRYLKKM